MKKYLFCIFNLFLIVLTLVYCMELKRMNEDLKLELNQKYEVIVKAFEDVETGFIHQELKIKEYKRDCENITSKVINGEW